LPPETSGVDATRPILGGLNAPSRHGADGVKRAIHTTTKRRFTVARSRVRYATFKKRTACFLKAPLTSLKQAELKRTPAGSGKTGVISDVIVTN
jgi:hypothetical protein